MILGHDGSQNKNNLHLTSFCGWPINNIYHASNSESTHLANQTFKLIHQFIEKKIQLIEKKKIK